MVAHENARKHRLFVKYLSSRLAWRPARNARFDFSPLIGCSDHTPAVEVFAVFSFSSAGLWQQKQKRPLLHAATDHLTKLLPTATAANRGFKFYKAANFQPVPGQADIPRDRKLR
jgi:hypothetical protein